MRLIVSPAKKMNVCSELSWQDVPRFADRTRVLADALCSCSLEELQALWACSDRLARDAYDRLWMIAPGAGPAVLSPAVLAYEGIQYQNLAPRVMTDDQLSYLQQHLRIVSGFYGLLSPFDAVAPYRLEMQAKLRVAGCSNLYEFWDSLLADALSAETDVVVNVASVEYAKAVVPHLERAGKVRVVTCLFGEETEAGAFVQRSTHAKAARGTFVRWCAENNVRDVRDFAQFDVAYRFDAHRSDADTFVFVRKR